MQLKHILSTSSIVNAMKEWHSWMSDGKFLGGYVNELYISTDSLIGQANDKILLESMVALWGWSVYPTISKRNSSEGAAAKSNFFMTLWFHDLSENRTQDFSSRTQTTAARRKAKVTVWVLQIPFHQACSCRKVLLQIVLCVIIVLKFDVIQYSNKLNC